MIITLLTWAVIAASAYASGAFLLSFTKSKSVQELEWYIPAGVAFLTVYAQTFSLFYHVGAMAFLLLFLLCVLFLVVLRKRHFSVQRFEMPAWKVVFVLVVILALAFWSAQEPGDSDTALYHAQAIRWIEEYGVVSGLGNLHCRFAYNSSFLCLQALFSFHWLGDGQSLHSVNGLACTLAVLYAVLTQSRKKRATLSDFLKLAVLVYIYEQRGSISSPNTDMLAMIMAWTIIVKWTELAEQNVQDSAPYCVLSILSVYAMTLKLSCALIVLLALYPFVLLIRRKEGRRLVLSLLSGIVCALPWMARSVMLSGYLIYPLYQIDLFNVDWKMSKEITAYDNMEIKVWGRGLRDIYKYDMPFSSWVKVWFSQESSLYKVLLVLAGIAFVLCVLSILTGLVRRRMSPAMAAGLSGLLACSLMWMFSAPDVRYGKIYVLLLNAYLLYRIAGHFGTVVVPLIAIPITAVLLSAVLVHDDGIFLQEADYPHYAVTGSTFEGQILYLPADGTQVSYEYFPTAPYPHLLNYIELRGDDISDGFRFKDEYRDLQLRSSGDLW